jgi:hypothetical protein
MLHEQLDIAHWKQVFSVARMRAEGQKPDDFNISGPRSIAVIEQLREETFATLPDIERVPTDIFILNRGEPEQRAVTKISGLPYRAAGKPWPMTPSGTTMNFVAQFCFADSRDFVPTLPGDLLLIFIEGKEIELRHRLPGWNSNIIHEFMWGRGEDRDSAVAFEWVSFGDFPLVTLKEIPETPWKITPFYGTLYRTWDYPNTDGFSYPHVAIHIATTLEAIKIGGIYPSPWIPQDDLGTYLCTLNSVFCRNDSYPFLNVPEPISAEEWRNSSSRPLTIGDMGLMNIFLAADGSIRWAADG